jgi:hypothetical protein
VPRTAPDFPELHSTEGLARLSRILTCYAHLDPELGYVQGMNFLAAQCMLAADLREDWAFVLFVAVMNPEMLGTDGSGEEASSASGEEVPSSAPPPVGMRSLYMDTSTGLAEQAYVVERVLDRFLPRLQALFEEQGVTLAHYFENLLTLYTLALPSNTLMRVWDAYFRDGDAALLRVMVVMLSDLEPYLLGRSGPMVEWADDHWAHSSTDHGRADFGRCLQLLKAFASYHSEQAEAVASAFRETVAAAASEESSSRVLSGANNLFRLSSAEKAKMREEEETHGWRRPCGPVWSRSGRLMLAPRHDIASRADMVPLTRFDASQLRALAVTHRDETMKKMADAAGRVRLLDKREMTLMETMADIGADAGTLGLSLLDELRLHAEGAVAGFSALVDGARSKNAEASSASHHD